MTRDEENAVRANLQGVAVVSIEVAAIVVLAYIVWCLERVIKMLRLIVAEKSTARWERGCRESLVRPLNRMTERREQP